MGKGGFPMRKKKSQSENPSGANQDSEFGLEMSRKRCSVWREYSEERNHLAGKSTLEIKFEARKTH